MKKITYTVTIEDIGHDTDLRLTIEGLRRPMAGHPNGVAASAGQTAAMVPLLNMLKTTIADDLEARL